MELDHVIVLILVIALAIGITGVVIRFNYQSEIVSEEKQVVAAKVTNMDCSSGFGGHASGLTRCAMGVKWNNGATTLIVNETTYAKYVEGDNIQIEVKTQITRDGRVLVHYAIVD